MATFNERFSEYATDMGLSPDQLSTICGIALPTVYAYLGRQASKRGPTLAGLLEIARKFGVTSDWLSGDSAHPRWREEVSMLRLWLRGQVCALPGDLTIQERMVSVLGLIQSRLPQAEQNWFLPGVIGVSPEGFERFMTGEGEVTTPMVERLATFTGLHKQWYRLGEPEELARVTAAEIDPAWLAVIEQYRSMGHQPEQHLLGAQGVDDFLKRQSRLSSI